MDAYRVTVFPFVQQSDGEEVIIGHPGRASFLAIPKEAAEALDWLASGLTIGSVRERFRSQYGEDLDLANFLAILERKGFLQVNPSDFEGTGMASATSPAHPLEDRSFHSHFMWIPEEVSRFLFNPTSIKIYSLLIATAIVLVICNPKLLPSWRALAFRDHFLAVALAGFGLNLVATFFHEMGHLLAARSLGIGARLGLGNRLWIIVAETDLTGLWSLPRSKRYLPFLAGALVDGVSASILIILLYFWNRSLPISPIPQVMRLVQAMLLAYLLRLTWQCYFFVRTDLYYVIANAFHCKNLLSDTEVFLKNLLRRFFPAFQIVDQSHIPASEMRFIRAYAWIWISGRVAALYILFAIQVPLLIHYLTSIFRSLAKGPDGNLLSFSESLVLTASSLALAASGLWLWSREMAKERRLRVQARS
jgi:putative peptide zinc metalloprotease protein